MKLACHLSHPQIIAGDCPWCNHSVAMKPTWHFPKLRASVIQGDELARNISIVNLVCHSDNTDQAFMILDDYYKENTGTLQDLTLTLRLGEQLSDAAVRGSKGRLECLRSSPAFAIAVLGKYFSQRFEDPFGRIAFEHALLALIEYFPTCAIHKLVFSLFDPVLEKESYAKGVQLWNILVKQNPQNLLLRHHAEHYCSFPNLNGGSS